MEDTKLHHEDKFFLPYNAGFICFLVIAVIVHMVECGRLLFSLGIRLNFCMICVYTLITTVHAGPIVLLIGIILMNQGIGDDVVTVILINLVFLGSVATFVLMFLCICTSKSRQYFKLRRAPSNLFIYLLVIFLVTGCILLALYCRKMAFVEYHNESLYFGSMRLDDINMTSYFYNPPGGGAEFRDYASLKLGWGDAWGCNEDDGIWCSDFVIACEKDNPTARDRCVDEHGYSQATDGNFQMLTYDRDVVPDTDLDWPFIYAYGNCNTCKARLRSDLANILQDALDIKTIGISFSLTGLVMVLCFGCWTKIRLRTETYDGSNSIPMNEMDANESYVTRIRKNTSLQQNDNGYEGDIE